MGWFGDDSSQADAYNQVCGLTAWRGDLCHKKRLTNFLLIYLLKVQSDNQASFSHELIAGAASYEAAKVSEFVKLDR